jgi:hypothetical protein
VSDTYELNNVDDWNFVAFLLCLFVVLLSNQRPELVEVQCGTETVIAVQVEVTHTDFTEISWMILVVVDSVMVHATSVTATTGMLSVLALNKMKSDEIRIS